MKHINDLLDIQKDIHTIHSVNVASLGQSHPDVEAMLQKYHIHGISWLIKPILIEGTIWEEEHEQGLVLMAKPIKISAKDTCWDAKLLHNLITKGVDTITESMKEQTGWIQIPKPETLEKEDEAFIQIAFFIDAKKDTERAVRQAVWTYKEIKNLCDRLCPPDIRVETTFTMDLDHMLSFGTPNKFYDMIERSMRSNLGTRPVRRKLHVKDMNISEHGVVTITAVGTFQIKENIRP